MEDNKTSNIQVFELSKYVQPKIDPVAYRRWILNGDNNSFYKYINDCYEGSTTNAGIINAFSNYIYGDGLVDKGGKDISRYISKKDVRLICLDYKLYGGFTVQVIWNQLKTKPIKIKYVPIYKIGLNLENIYTNPIVNGYWYSFDWLNQYRYKPELFTRFSGIYHGNDVEISMIQRPSSKPFFSNPDYVAALQYAEVEMELANSSISHIHNGFQGGTLINMNSGIPPTEELKEEYKKKILDHTTGSGQRNRVIIAFNESAENAMTVDNLSVPELNQQYESFDEIAEKRIMVGHSVPPILFSGTKEGGGLGNNAEEIATATKSLYRKHINPLREVILDGLMEIFLHIDPMIDLDFVNFDEEDLDTNTPVVPTTQMGKHECSADNEFVLTPEQESHVIEVAMAAIGSATEEGTYYRYVSVTGRAPQRRFCRVMMSLDKLYSKADINKMSFSNMNSDFAPTGTNNYSIFKYRGGVNCKHAWKEVEVRLDENDIPVEYDRGIVDDSPVGNKP